jgi:hypothetical protein
MGFETTAPREVLPHQTVLTMFEAAPNMDAGVADSIIEDLDNGLPIANSLVVTELISEFESAEPVDTLRAVTLLGSSSRTMTRLLAASTGVFERYRVWEHTQAALYRFDEDPPGEDFDPTGRKVVRTTLLLMDLGKPIALAITGSKDDQGEYNLPVGHNVLESVSDGVLDQDDKQTIELLMSHDLIGRAVRGKIPLEDAVAQLGELREQCPEKHRAQFDAYARAIYLADATSYTWFAKYKDTGGNVHRSLPSLNIFFRRRPGGVSFRQDRKQRILDTLTSEALDTDENEIWEQIASPSELVGWHTVAGALGRVVRRGMEDKEERPYRVRAIDAFMSHIPPLQLEHVASPEIERLHAEAGFWHGAGRFRYSDGEVIDVLSAITESGAVRAHLDAFDVVTGPMEIISLSRARMYARAYADMFRFQPGTDVRYGDSQFWGSVYLTDTIIQSLIENKVWTLEGYRTMMDHVGENKLRDWCAKFTSAEVKSTTQLYRAGSDIPGNHPILFGIRPGSFAPVATSQAVALHEVRTRESLNLPGGDITHLEVPLAHLEEDTEVLKSAGFDLPVVAIEDAERHLARTAFSALVLGRAA